MAKVLAPLGGNQASGSIGRELTFTNTKGLHIVKSFPTHPDAQTLAQLYQRRLYYDAKEYWNQLNAAQKLVFNQAAKGHNWSGFNQALKDYLADPADLNLWYRMDRPPGATLPDFSGKGNTGTIYGCAHAEGRVGSSMYFDGVDDRVKIGHPTGIADIDTLSIEGWFYPTASIDHLFYGSDGNPAGNFAGLHIKILDTEAIQIVFADGIGNDTFATGGGVVNLNAWNHIVFTFNQGFEIQLFHNATRLKNEVSAITTIKTTFDYWIGNFSGTWLKGMVDDFRIYNRVLWQDQITQHYERGA